MPAPVVPPVPQTKAAPLPPSMESTAPSLYTLKRAWGIIRRKIPTWISFPGSMAAAIGCLPAERFDQANSREEESARVLWRVSPKPGRVTVPFEIQLYTLLIIVRWQKLSTVELAISYPVGDALKR